MRRDLELDCDPAELVLEPPDRSQLKEIFRRFEFRGLLSRLDTLDAALPSASPRLVVAESQPWQEGDVPKLTGRIGVAVEGDGWRWPGRGSRSWLPELSWTSSATPSLSPMTSSRCRG